MDYDYKRLRGILLGFIDKQGDNVISDEYKERDKVAEMLKRCNDQFQIAFND